MSYSIKTIFIHQYVDKETGEQINKKESHENYITIKIKRYARTFERPNTNGTNTNRIKAIYTIHECRRKPRQTNIW